MVAVSHQKLVGFSGVEPASAPGAGAKTAALFTAAGETTIASSVPRTQSPPLLL